MSQAPVIVGEIYDFRYRVVGASLWTTRISIPITSYQITGLAYATTYEMQVRAVNLAGDSAWTASAMVTTDAAPTLVPVPVPIAGTVVRIELKEFGSNIWVGVNGRLKGVSRLTEGRSIDELGGALPAARPSQFSVQLANQDDYFTTGVGAPLIVGGSQLRIRWGTLGLANITRFVGNIASRRREYDGGLESINCTYYGNLWKITAASQGQQTRLFITETPTSVFKQFATANGIEAANVDVDVDATEYSLLVRGGREGVTDIQDATGGFIYDAPDGKVRLELPATRANRVARRGNTDLAPRAGEVGIPKPRNLEQAFGVINRVEAQLRVFAPKEATPAILVYNISTRLLVTLGYSGETCLQFDSGGLIGDAATLAFSYRLQYQRLESPPSVGPTLSWSPVIAGEALEVEITAASVIHDGTSISFCFDHTGRNISASRSEVVLLVSITLNNPHSLAFETHTASEFANDGQSQLQFGTRPRGQPIVFGSYRATPLPADFTLSAAAKATLQTAAQRELADFLNPIPVYAIDHRYETDILARRLSDREHLRLADGTNSGFFVEALETDVVIPPQLLQTAYYANHYREPL